MKDAATVYAAKDGGWTLSEAAAKKDAKGKAIRVGKEGKPAEINHGNIVPTLADGGFTLTRALQTTVISLPTLRRLRFPLGDSPESDPKVDLAARTVLAALGLLGATLSIEAGADLRLRCQLVAQSRPVWELLDAPGELPSTFSLTGEQAVQLFRDAFAAARSLGLPWEEEISLAPSDDLLRLFAKSQELAMHQAEGGD